MIAAGLDIGGTKTEAVALDRDGSQLAAVRLATRGGGELVSAAGEALQRLAADAGVDRFASVGVGVPGLVSPVGDVRHAVNLGIDGTPVDLGRRLAALVGAPVVVDNDARAAAVGAAAVLGHHGDLAYLSVGTGVAVGLVIGGQPHRGARGAAGEIGHLQVDPAGPRCDCGQRGCLEAVASGAAIARAWPQASTGSPAAALFAAAAAGDATAVRIRDRVAVHLADAIARIALTVDPEIVVVGGGVADVGPPLLDALAAAIERRAGEVPLLGALALAERLTLLPAGTPAGAIGAAAIGRAGAWTDGRHGAT